MTSRTLGLKSRTRLREERSMTAGPNAESPRFQAVKRNAAALIEIAEAHGARRISLCGSVARGQDHDRDDAAGVSESDIDFYASEFRAGDDARERAEALVAAYQSVVSQFKVDVRAWAMPAWLPVGRP